MRVGQDRASAQLWLCSCLLSRDSQWAHPWALDEFLQCRVMAAGKPVWWWGAGCCCCEGVVLCPSFGGMAQ